MAPHDVTVLDYTDPKATDLNISVVPDWSELNGKDQLIYTLTYLAPVQPPKATMTVLHGYGEHIDRYGELMRHFAQAGVNVLGFDQRGFGRTGRRKGPLGHTGGWKVLEMDIYRANERIREPGVPHFMFGQSMGGANVLTFATRDDREKDNLAGIIVSAPALIHDPKIRPNPAVVWAGSQLARVFPTLPMSANVPTEALSKDAEEVQLYKESYYNFDEATIRSFADLLRHGKELIGSERPARLRIPLLLVHGEDDHVASIEGSRRFEKYAVNCPDLTFKSLPGEFHEPHKDSKREELFATYTSWILEHIGEGTTDTSK
ncbi:MAG: Alpha/Beta hydrolase protein [Piptocephalis tieghemiana]|nr:MAG: Alpha/Beta hydrolase protein [Piptocephalis tieghemiana]